ncbi:MAG: PBP1A family penicillin-binding protein [Oculatellaceae cyanobacterium Prado106]|nr:PBP1A family penicillin-binding protein [Oculatellaceae cyanobacterium Prado106]
MKDYQTNSGDLSNQRIGRNSTKPTTEMSGNPQFSNHSNEPELPALPMFDRAEDIEVEHVAPPPPEKGRRRSPRFSLPPMPKVPMPRRWWTWALLVLGLGAAGGGVALQQTLAAIERDLPNPKDVLTYNRAGSITIKAEDGAVLQQIGPATRDKVTLAKMPKLLSEAFIASEDTDFYQHEGVDYQAVVRASLANLFAGQVVEGASTITQQLSRIAFLDQERSLGRKVREALLAQKMERELQKDQILESYLNLVYLGAGAYGVADAAWVYFSKTADQLTLGEMAMIAAMAPAPSSFSPLVNPDLARQRRNIVLQRMVTAGFITESERASAAASPIELNPSTPKHLYSETPYFTSYIQQELPKVISGEELEMGGLTVETTMNLKWQKLAQDTVKNAIADYGYGQVFEQAALVAIDPRNGQIKALVGGDDFEKSQFNRATQAQRQPGSTFKAFVYATAIAAGFSPYTTYVDGKLIVDGYEPSNYSKSFRGAMTMKDALASSINIVAVKVLIDVGFDPVIQLSRKMGIKSPLLGAYALSLGASEVNLLELTSAYGTLAAEGNHYEAHGITRVLNRFGKVIYESKVKPVRAIDADSASITTWMLEGVVNQGTGGAAALPDRGVAGKTGTSEKRRDLWFVGYIPQLVTGVWMGNDDSSPTWGASSTAAATWYDFMIEATDGMKVEEFPDIPDVEGRDGTIKAEPITPGRMTASDAVGPDTSADQDSGSSGGWSDPTVDSSGSGSYYEEPTYYDDGGSSGSGSGGGSADNWSAPSEPAYTEPAPSAPAASEPPISSPESAAPVAPISEPPPVVVPVEPAEPALPAPVLTTP